jgi:hypothetical protein
MEKNGIRQMLVILESPWFLANVRGLPLRAPDRDWKADTLPELAVVSC